MRNTLKLALFLSITGWAAWIGTAGGADVPLERRGVVPELANDAPTSPRTFAMGFGMTPPIPATESVIETIDHLSEVSEYTIIQREVPWTRIRAGDSIGTILDEDWDGLVEYLTQARGLNLVVLIDPLDGLDRTREAVEARTNNVTLRDASSRAVHAAFILEVARRYQPAYLGLASEINTLAAHGDMDLYVTLRGMINGLIPELRQVSPGSRLFVSYQVDDMWGLTGLPSAVGDQFALVHDFAETDVVGISSYPVFFWERPEDVPGDYYTRLADEAGKPVIQVEGGWSSERTPWMAPGREATPAVQTRYLIRLFELLDSVRAELVVLLLYPDLDLEAPGWGLDSERKAGLSNFAHMGIVDTQLQPKPAYAVWEAAFRRPLAGP